VSVTTDAALGFSAVSAAITLLADSVSGLPCPGYKRIPGGKERAPELAAHRLLNVEANSYQSALAFRNLLTAHALVHGNGIAEIERDGSGIPVALWPITPTAVTPSLVDVGGTTVAVYDVALPDGGKRRLLGENVLHIPAFTLDGLWGKSPIRQHRETIGLGIAQESFAASFFGNGGKPPGALKIPGKADPEEIKHMREEWARTYGGLDNAHRIAFLTQGTEYVNIGSNNEDSQLIASREFSVIDVARIYRVPPVFLQDLGRATWSNTEQLGIHFVVYSLMPWLRRWETEASRKLLLPEEQDTYFLEHVVAGLLRGDTTARYTSYQTAITAGFMTRNEARELENWNPLPGLDVPTIPLNMASAGATPEPTKAPPMMQDAKRFQPLIADTCGRIARRQAGAAKKGTIDFAEHGEFMRQALGPVFIALGVGPQLAGVIDAHLEASRSAPQDEAAISSALVERVIGCVGNAGSRDVSAGT
jgi:HK97 family phage portal protein